MTLFFIVFFSNPTGSFHHFSLHLAIPKKTFPIPFNKIGAPRGRKWFVGRRKSSWGTIWQYLFCIGMGKAQNRLNYRGKVLALCFLLGNPYKIAEVEDIGSIRTCHIPIGRA